jgi:hypothetical protein
MPRPRLRFQLQELDLPLGATVIGRDPECHVTLDDPLVSRRHARILVGADRVVVEDLGSRNGVLLNGIGVRGPTPLQDSDRLRVGAQHLVYCEAEVEAVPPSLPSRPTAELGLCTGCRLPYPRQLTACPSCEATEQVDEDTLVDPRAPRTSEVYRMAASAGDAPGAAADFSTPEIMGGHK